MNPRITSLGTALPPYELPRDKATEAHIAAVDATDTFERHIRALHRASGIQHRHTVVPDFLQNGESPELFPEGFKQPFPGTKARMEIYRKTALPLAKQAAQRAIAGRSLSADAITHLVVVSCTGMYAPGLDIELVAELGLPSTTQRTAINFMGCYGAFPGLKLAHAQCKADPNATVLVVCVELCSLHFQHTRDEDTLLSMALFGDGAAAALVENTQEVPGLAMEGFYNDLAPEGKADMAWAISDFGFEMKLSAYVPKIIEGGIAPLTHRLLQSLGMEITDIEHFAIHPGGRSILQAIERQLALTTEDNRHAYQVLRECGNMSSPTVLFVLQRVWNELGPDNAGEHVLSFAFGPGLTLESGLYSYQV